MQIPIDLLIAVPSTVVSASFIKVAQRKHREGSDETNQWLVVSGAWFGVTMWGGVLVFFPTYTGVIPLAICIGIALTVIYLTRPLLLRE